jgi:ABC-type sulfate transport system substrate-binding protein
VIPNFTTAIENPVALIDKNVDKHGNRAAAEAFLDFLWSKDAQKVFADKGFRPVDDELAKQYESHYQVPKGLFDISYLGGWPQANKDLYGKGALWETILAEGGTK